jgi:hypothetical protein
VPSEAALKLQPESNKCNKKSQQSLRLITSILYAMAEPCLTDSFSRIRPRPRRFVLLVIVASTALCCR